MTLACKYTSKFPSMNLMDGYFIIYSYVHKENLAPLLKYNFNDCNILSKGSLPFKSFFFLFLNI